jgi:ABC-type phosphate transport system substrate-binding protein
MAALFHRRSFLAFALVLGAAIARPETVRAQAADGLVVIVHARNPTQSVSMAELKKVFLGQTSFWHGVVPVRVFVRPDESAPSKAFYPKVLDMTAAAFRKHWDKQQLSGRAVAPATAATAEEIAKKVASVPGGIGFALASETWSLQVKDVKFIQVQ